MYFTTVHLCMNVGEEHWVEITKYIAGNELLGRGLHSPSAFLIINLMTTIPFKQVRMTKVIKCYKST